MSWTIERRGRVAVVTMTTNPVNAQNQAFFADLHDAFDGLEHDHPDSPVVLTGTGRRFSAGLDLDEHFRLFAGDPAAVGSWFAGYRATNMRLFTYPRPTVALSTATPSPVGSLRLRSATTASPSPKEPRSGSTRYRSVSRCPRSMSACSPTPGASRSRPGPRCSVRSSAPPRRTPWAWCANSSRPRTCRTGPWPSPGRHPRTARAVRLHQTRLPGRGTTRHRGPGRPARHRASQVDDERARPARAPPLLAAAQRPAQW